MIKHFLNPPNWFTSASLFCSTYAIVSLIAADDITAPLLSRACVLVIFGGIFDLLDGRVARMTQRFTDFGVQLDSIADMVGFGVAPAMIAWAWCLHEMGVIGVFIAFWYVLCTAFRLARFNVNTSEESWSLPGHAQGLTSTVAGGVLVTMIWVANSYLYGVLAVPNWVVATLTAYLGFLMISSIPFRNFRDIRNNRPARRILAITLSFSLVAAIVLDPSMLWGMGALLYLTVGLADGLIVAVQQKKLRKILFVEELEEALEIHLSDGEVLTQEEY